MQMAAVDVDPIPLSVITSSSSSSAAAGPNRKEAGVVLSLFAAVTTPGSPTVNSMVPHDGQAGGEISYSRASSKWKELNHDLVRHFKPLFKSYGSRGIPIRVVEEEMVKVQQAQGLQLQSRDVIAQRLQRADVNKDKVITYREFQDMVTEDVKKDRQRALKSVLLSAAITVGLVKKQKRHDFLANYRFCPPPLFIPIITLIQVAVFAGYAADMASRGEAVTANSGYPYYSPLHYKADRRHEAWRFLTYILVHKGYMHLVLNMAIQLLFGFALELVHGWWRVAIIYLTGVISGSLAHSVLDSRVGLVGASGGGYAIFGAHVAAVIINWSEMNYRVCQTETKACCFFCRIALSAPVRLAFVLLIVVAETGLTMYDRITEPAGSQVGITAHIGGFLTGLFVGIRVLKNVLKHPWEGILGWVTLSLCILVCTLAIFFNVFYWQRYPPTDWS